MTNAKMFSVQMRNLMRAQRVSPITQTMQKFATATPTKRAIFEVDSVEDFEHKVKRSDKPVIVDFCASWCSPCRMLEPRLMNIVSEKAGEVCLAKVDIDEHCDLALDYNVGAVPALLVMHRGKVLDRMVGLQSTDVIRDWVDGSVNRNKPTRALAKSDGEQHHSDDEK